MNKFIFGKESFEGNFNGTTPQLMENTLLLKEDIS